MRDIIHNFTTSTSFNSYASARAADHVRVAPSASVAVNAPVVAVPLIISSLLAILLALL